MNHREYSYPGSDCVKIFVDILRNALDLGIQFILDGKKIMLVILCDKVNCYTEVAESTWSTDSVKISFSIFWEVKIDNDVNCLNIDTSSKNICAYKASCLIIFEVMEYPI